MRTHIEGTSSFLVAGIVGAALTTAFIFLWRTNTFTEVVLRKTTILSVLFCIVLITLSTYLVLSVSERARLIAEEMTKSMLAYSHELFSELYRSSPVPYILIDERGHIESSNTAAVRLFNVTLDALDGLRIFDFIEDKGTYDVTLIPEYFRQGKFINDVEVLIRRPDGMVKWVMLSLFSFRDSERKTKGLLTLVDITKQKMVDKAKTEFVSLASHQLRTPVSAMRWNLELLTTATGEHLSKTQQTYVDKIGSGLKRMDALIEDFLSASKLELGTLTAKKAPFNVKEFFASVYDEYKVSAEKRNIHIETNWHELTGEYTSDAHLLNMVVSNVFGNAIKYTKEGGVVRAHTTRDASGFVVRIQDTGIGIPEEEQEMIFSKLFRASNAQTQETDGTGLGLYIVKEAVHILGGEISFTSQSGVGTTFTIVLPA